jgi:large subunit ribosomal protein L6
MSKIGNNPIKIPSGVKVSIDSTKNQYGGVTVISEGTKGSLRTELFAGIGINIEGDTITMTRENDSKMQKSFHGLYRSLVNNSVIGVANGYTKTLEIQGIGYKAELNGDKLSLKIGFSHPVVIKAPEGIEFEVTDGTTVKVSGIDKALVGKITADIRSKRKPEPYKGKGIRYAGEEVKKKSGKSAAK